MSSLNDSLDDFQISPSSVLPPKIIETKPPAVKKSVKTAKKSKKKCIEEGEDPNLEMAIAISASLSSQIKEDVLLPGATMWTGGETTSKRKKKVTAKTRLQVRTPEERNRLVSEKVSEILTEDTNNSRASSLQFYPPLVPITDHKSRVLNSAKDSNCKLWKLSTTKYVGSSHYVDSLFEPFNKTDPAPRIETDICSSYRSLVGKNHGSDIRIFVKDEKEISAHSLIFYARFPVILKDVISENDNECRMLFWSDVNYEEAIVFLNFVYAGIRPENVTDGVKILAQKYGIRVFHESVDSAHDDDNEDDEDDDNNDERGTTATQNLDALVNELEEEIENDESVIDENQNNGKEVIKDNLESVIDLTQDSNPEDHNSSPEIVPLETDPMTTGRTLSSPDMFASDDDDDENSRKRNSSGSISNDRKRSRLDSFETEITDRVPQTPVARFSISANFTTEVEKARDEIGVSSTEDKEKDGKTVPDYESMLSPALRQELSKFGLKVIPRNKACKLLKYIYEETCSQNTPEEQICSQASSSTQEGEDLLEEALNLDQGDDEEGETVDTDQDIPLLERLRDFIRSDPEMKRQILLYEPIVLEDFVKKFKKVQGLKRCKVSDIMDILDSECITFRSSKPKKGKETN